MMQTIETMENLFVFKRFFFFALNPMRRGDTPKMTQCQSLAIWTVCKELIKVPPML